MPDINPLRQAAYAPTGVQPIHALPWADDALCAQHDPELWFTDSEDPDFNSQRRVREAVAKDICKGCPVAAECLAYALSSDQRYGIWGGLAAWERRQMRFAGRRA